MTEKWESQRQNFWVNQAIDLYDNKTVLNRLKIY